MDLDFLRNQYEFELERKNELSSAVGLPGGLLTALGGLLGYMAQHFSFEFRYLTAGFVFGLGFAGAFFVTAVVLLIRSYWGHAYQYIPSPGVLQKYRDALRDYYQTTQGNDGPTEAEFSDYLARKIIEATDANTFANDSKSAYLHRGNGMVIGVLVFTIASGIPYVVDAIRQTEKVPKVQITNFQELNLKDINMANEKPQNAPPPPQKPAEPGNRILREGEQPKKEKR